jgi:broad specificity phosphatase PhoE
MAHATLAEVLIIRHAEKPAGVGEDEGSDLSPRGFERANALVGLFTKDSRVLSFGTPVAIYAGSPKKADGSIRPLQTIQPTATALGLAPITKFESKDYDSMISEVMTSKEYDGKTVLVSWAHDEIPAMAHDFGIKKSEVPKWKGEIFDRVWRIDFDANGDVTDFEDLPQRLLPGDSND